jgi:protein-tyrosine phosphatase
MKAYNIADRIWIGGLLATRDLPSNFTVISILSDPKLLEMVKMFLRDGQSHVHWTLKDNIKSNFLCNDLIRILSVIDTCRPVLVHCAKGLSRSVAVCAAWFMSRRHCSTLQEAMDVIRIVRPHANPNLGFIASLKLIENHNGDIEAAIKSRNLRDSV